MWSEVLESVLVIGRGEVVEAENNTAVVFGGYVCPLWSDIVEVVGEVGVDDNVSPFCDCLEDSIGP